MVWFSDLLDVMHPVSHHIQEDSKITKILIDSRKVTHRDETLFFAIPGHQHDGHNFIYDLFIKGLRNFIIQDGKYVSEEVIAHANYLVVKNVMEALQELAGWHRRKHSNLIVCGITGSNGKTIVKDWLSQILSQKYQVVKNPKSYNSQVGVPLSLWKIQEGDHYGVFEAGISQPGEMGRLAKIILPRFGIFTTLGSAHDEGFDNRAAKAREKALLFSRSDMVVYHSKYTLFAQALLDINPHIQHIDWQLAEGNDASYTVNLQLLPASNSILVKKNGSQHEFNIPFIDRASIENLINIIIFLLEIDFDKELIQIGLNRLQRVEMRLEFKKGLSGNYIIDDSYNNDLGGLEVALDFLSGQKQRTKKAVILSDILQSGMNKTNLYKQVAGMILSRGIDHFIGVGPDLKANQDLFQPKAKFFHTTEELLKSGVYKDFLNSIILIKGARTFHFEKLVEQLQEKEHDTVLEINLDALTNNLNLYRGQLNPQTKVMVMVKAFAYGSGSLEVANLMQFHQVDYLAVAYADEGIYLRQNGITVPIMVLNPKIESLEKFFIYGLEPEVYSFRLLKEVIDVAEKRGEQLAIHLKIDTGMHRLGFEPSDVEELLNILNMNRRYIEIKGIMSHLAGADSDIHDEFTLQQGKAFAEICKKISGKLAVHPIRHLLNSSGISRFPQFHFDMVRLGIGLYGYDPSNVFSERLQRVAILKTTISQIKNVKKGDSIGYSRTGVMKKDGKIATIAIGYADGFDRRLSNGKGHVVVNGSKAPVIGNVCMDMTMVDVTEIAVQEGDEVIIFGEEPTLEELAEKLETIPYEILTKINERVKRVFISS